MDDKFSSQTKTFLDNNPALKLIEEFTWIQNQSKEIPGLTAISFSTEINQRSQSITLLDKERGTLSIELIRIKNQFIHCYRTFETKLNYITKAKIYALNNNNFLVFANCARGLVEHAASISFQLKKGNQCLTNLSSTKGLSEAKNFLKEYHDHLNKLFYGTRFFKQEGLLEAIGVLSLIDNYLAKEIKSIREYYDFLCDFVHPNFGSNIIVTSGTLAEGVIDPPFEQKKEIVMQILKGVGRVYEYLNDTAVDFSKIGINFDNFIEKIPGQNCIVGKPFFNIGKILFWKRQNERISNLFH